MICLEVKNNFSIIAGEIFKVTGAESDCSVWDSNVNCLKPMLSAVHIRPELKRVHKIKM